MRFWLGAIQRGGGGGGLGGGAAQAAEKATTVNIPGRQPVLFATRLKDLDAAFANLRPPRRAVVRLSVPLGNNVFFGGCVDVVSGSLMLATKDGSMTFFPHGKAPPISVKLPSGIVKNTFAKPTAKVRVVAKDVAHPIDLWAVTDVYVYLHAADNPGHKGAAAQSRQKVGGYDAGIWLNGALNEHRNNVDLSVSSRDFPCEVSGSRLIATLKVSTSSDFKGTFSDWAMPAPK